MEHIKVTLREAKMTCGTRLSLYLDFYPAILNPKTNKPTRREYLKEYIKLKPKNTIEKQANKDARQRAKMMETKRRNELNKSKVYSYFEKEQLKIQEKKEASFIEYFQKLIDRKQGKTYYNWLSTLKYLKSFASNNVTFGDVDQEFCNDFREYLLNAKSTKDTSKDLSINTAMTYFKKFKAALKQAYKEDFLQKDLNLNITPISPIDTEREYLSQEEVERLKDTPCKDKLLERVSFFSITTGMRFSDIQKLVWGDIVKVDDKKYLINFRQKKTKNIEALPINDTAYKLLGTRGKPDEQVFEGLSYSKHNNKKLAEWMQSAGITKKITFHCFRHTFATLLLTKGIDIYTVSKLLGHKDLKATQIYAKVIDSKKREALIKLEIDLYFERLFK